ncbi:hypothetical protein ACFSFW_23540 [Fredinandcohnia salidurans]|uniref:Uncharacterized protein n=1 Tax=Fredinandcohnia salidurans TaxID=2595041 RepID=A0ABW4MV97_9BACI
MLSGCVAQGKVDPQKEINEVKGVPTQEEIEYYAVVVATTELMKEYMDLFSEVNGEAGKHPSVMQTEKWWEDLSTALISFRVAIDGYNKNEKMPAESQKEIHELILRTHEPLAYVADNFGDAITNKDADKVNICFDKMGEAREYIDKAIKMNNKQFEEWENNAQTQ